jgi:hypothetical protein
MSEPDEPKRKFVHLDDTNNFRVEHCLIQGRLDASASTSSISGRIHQAKNLLDLIRSLWVAS